jgi:hypothetical protein
LALNCPRKKKVTTAKIHMLKLRGYLETYGLLAKMGVNEKRKK